MLTKCRRLPWTCTTTMVGLTDEVLWVPSGTRPWLTWQHSQSAEHPTDLTAPVGMAEGQNKGCYWVPQVSPAAFMKCRRPHNPTAPQQNSQGVPWRMPFGTLCWSRALMECRRPCKCALHWQDWQRGALLYCHQVPQFGPAALRGCRKLHEPRQACGQALVGLAGGVPQGMSFGTCQMGRVRPAVLTV